MRMLQPQAPSVRITTLTPTNSVIFIDIGVGFVRMHTRKEERDSFT